MQSILPIALTPLIGRGHEIDNLRQLLVSDAVRLVTLTGPGGVGKTRLALAAANELADQFGDGVSFVSLASVTDSSLVIPTLAASFGLRDKAGQFAIQELKNFLRDQDTLLLLDNFEQVATAAPALTELLAATTRLKMLVTSRVVLRVRGEYEFPVSPLHKDLTSNPAVTLFLERASAALPNHSWNSADLAAIAEICERLDGLPLAIELAAARVKLLPPQILLSRLEHRLAVLTDGARDLPARQQTLKNTLTWSYDLLDSSAQCAFRRLAVFVGGCALDAAEHICSADLDVLTMLTNHSLVQLSQTFGDTPRIEMLETIREYARDALRASGEDAPIENAHRAFYLGEAETAAPHLLGANQQTWLERLERDHGNFRAALQSSIQQSDAETALRLGAALARFWYVRGFLSEGHRWLEQSLALTQTVAPRVRLGALNAAGLLAASVGLYARTASLSEEGLKLARALNDTEQIVAALNGLGNASLWRGE